MNAVRIHRHGGPEVLQHEEMPKPALGPGEVLVEVKACALNHLDIWTRSGRRGKHEVEVDLPLTLGSDVSGIVRAAGSSLSADGLPAVGDPVLLHPGGGCGSCSWCLRGDDNNCDRYQAIGVTRDGGYAEWVVVPARDAIRMPDHLDFVQGACIPLTYLTAWHMIVRKAQIRPMENVLIHAAGSGVGAAALQIVKVLGARVLATASTEEKLAKAKGAGADEVINYSQPGFARRVHELTEGHGVDVVIDSVGSHVFEESVRALAVGGRIASCGATADASVKLDLHVLQGKRATFYFTVMGSRADFLDTVRFVETFKLEPLVDRVLPLREAPEAHRLLEGRKNFGKIVLVPEGGLPDG